MVDHMHAWFQRTLRLDRCTTADAQQQHVLLSRTVSYFLRESIVCCCRPAVLLNI